MPVEEATDGDVHVHVGSDGSDAEERMRRGEERRGEGVVSCSCALCRAVRFAVCLACFC